MVLIKMFKIYSHSLYSLEKHIKTRPHYLWHYSCWPVWSHGRTAHGNAASAFSGDPVFLSSSTPANCFFLSTFFLFTFSFPCHALFQYCTVLPKRYKFSEFCNVSFLQTEDSSVQSKQLFQHQAKPVTHIITYYSLYRRGCFWKIRSLQRF